VHRSTAAVPYGPTRIGSSYGAAADGMVDPAEVAAGLARSAGWPGAASLSERSWRRVALTPKFDAWLIVWPRGGEIDLHDHGDSRGALLVIEGVLTEFVPQWDGTGCLQLQRLELWEGTTHRLGGGHVHSVTNESDRHALSLHVYSPALSSMTFFDLAGDDLVARTGPWRADDDENHASPAGWREAWSDRETGPR